MIRSALSCCALVVATYTKFRLTGDGIQPSFYWVSDDDVLRQVLIGERKLMRLQNDRDEGE